MPTVLITRPIKKGKTEAYKAFMNECLGPKKDDYKDLLLRFDLNTVKMWIGTLNGKDYAMFTHDMGAEAAKRLESWPSTHAFDQWFDSNLRDCYDEDVAQPEFIGELDARK